MDKRPKTFSLSFVVCFVGVIAFIFFVFKSFAKKSEKDNLENGPPVTISIFPTIVRRPDTPKPTVIYEKFPFKATDKIRKLEIVSCVVDNSPWGMSYPKKVVDVQNNNLPTTEIMKAFLVEASQNGWGGFPKKEEVKSFEAIKKQVNPGFSYQFGEVILRKLTIDKYGLARVYFSQEAEAYRGGAARVACMQDSVELTLKQFPNIKSVVLCQESVCADQKGSTIFQP